MTVVTLLSFLLRAAATVWAAVLARRARDWRLAALALFFAVLAARPILQLARIHSFEMLPPPTLALAGLALSVVGLLALLGLDRALAAGARAAATREREAERNRALVERDSALRESEERYRLVAEHARDIIWTLDFEGRIGFVSPAVERILGFTPEEQLARIGTFDMLTPASAARAAEIWERALREGRSEFRHEAEHWRKDGSTVWCEIHAAIERDADGRPRRVLGVTRDITERKQAEQTRARLESELWQAQRMEAVGQLAGGVAHDFNNYLTVILGHAEYALASPATPEDLQESLQQIQRAAERSAALTRQLLAFSRRQLMRPRVFDLGELVEGMEPLLRRVLGEHIQLRTLRADASVPVWADPAQIEQCVLNLALNARDAMQGGGVLTLEIGEPQAREDGAPPREAADRDRVLLSVRDTGHGMDAATLARIFEPFFTTKEEGHGTGLGLASVYGIVRQSAGSIDVSSTPGHGTCFRILLPRAAGTEAHGAAPTEAAGPSALAAACETILLIEDEPQVREFARRVLELQGFRVLEAVDGRHALELAGRSAESIDLVLTDVRMPRLGGPETVAQLRAMRPGLRVLYMSGHAEGAIGTQAVEASLLLEKPFGPHELLGRVRSALDAA